MADEGENMDANWPIVWCKFLKVHWKAVFSVLWPLISLLIFLLGFDAEFRCMYILFVMAGYWVTECIPLYITGLIPIFMCPMMKVVDTKSICTTYMNSTNALFIAGMMVAITIEHTGLHLRLALNAMLAFGCSPRRLHFGLATVTMFMSMFLINAAATAMMCPIIMAILRELEVQGILTVYEPPDPENPTTEAPLPTKMTVGFFLSAPYSANIGGISTLVGTGTNLAYKGLFEDKYPTGNKIDFLPWCLYNIPGVFVSTLISWFSLQITCLGMFQPKSKEYQICKMGRERKDAIREVIKGRLKELGPMDFREGCVAFLFIVTIAAWIFRSPQLFTGWADGYGPNYVKDSSFPFLVIILLFLIPASCQCFSFCTRDRTDRPTKPSKGLMTWDVFHRKFPWGMLFLIGGGFAIAHAGKVSGMSSYLGECMEVFKPLHPIAVLLICTFMGSMFTELTSNVAICNILVPVLMDMSYAMDVHPMLYTFPTALCCSFSFLMPTGTPTNAIALGYAGIPTIFMIKHGLITKAATWLIQCALFPTYGRLFFDTSSAPDWMYVTEKSNPVDH